MVVLVNATQSVGNGCDGLFRCPHLCGAKVRKWRATLTAFRGIANCALQRLVDVHVVSPVLRFSSGEGGLISLDV